ncbi:MAG: prenyltransferase/squalene oxidase repeat-containing protein, partial [Planctomycetota bacterium]
MCKWLITVVAVVAAVTFFEGPVTFAVERVRVKPLIVDKQEEKDEKSTREAVRWAPAVDPKPLSENVKKALRWIVEHQDKNGGWSQGEESTHMGRGMDHLIDKPNVADTCGAVLALIRSGSTPSKGPYAKNIRAGVKFVIREVENSDANSLFITQTRGTRLQMKLGTYIDTFLASMVFAEVTGKMPNNKSEAKLADALDKLLNKIGMNQRSDGTFGGTGWANTLSVSMATKGINRAAQANGQVSEQVRQRIEDYARGQYDQ